MEYRSSNALSADLDFLIRDRFGNRIGLVPLTEGAKKRCPVCGHGVWFRNAAGELEQDKCDQAAHGLMKTTDDAPVAQTLSPER
jgi:uncharacterized protein (DUF983 family)